MVDPYKYKDYRSVIKSFIESDGERGIKSKLAEAAGCQLSYLSQALSGTVQLTDDHAFGIASFIGLDARATEYLSLMVRAERASSKTLRKYLLARMSELEREAKILSNRLDTTKIQSKYRQQYYSAWFYSAVHIALSIPKFQSQKQLVKALELAPETARKAIEFLLEMGAIEKYRDFYRTIDHNIHIPSNSPLHISYNLTWRSFMSHRTQAAQDSDIHYTAVHSLSESDFNQLRDMILDFIDRSRKLVEPSTEETLAAITIDFCGFDPGG